MKRKPYEILGVAANATREEATAAFRRLAAKTHPDRPGGNHDLFTEAKKALDAFVTQGPCPVCAGKGVVLTRAGFRVFKKQCPQCWRK